MVWFISWVQLISHGNNSSQVPNSEFWIEIYFHSWVLSRAQLYMYSCRYVLYVMWLIIYEVIIKIMNSAKFLKIIKHSRLPNLILDVLNQILGCSALVRNFFVYRGSLKWIVFNYYKDNLRTYSILHTVITFKNFIWFI